MNESAIKNSELLVNMVETDPGASEYPISVDACVLKEIIRYLEYHMDKDPPNPVQRPIRSGLFEQCGITYEWDVQFMNETPNIFQLVWVANYMGITTLVDLGCCKIACMFRGKTATELRTNFGVDCPW
jgi:hypothetical protein